MLELRLNGGRSRSSGPLISDLLDVVRLPFICSRVFNSMSQKTYTSKHATCPVSTICQRAAVFPAPRRLAGSDAVPRSGGMKISLFIMEDNQISDASLCLPAKKEKGESGGGELKRKGLKQHGCNQYTAGSLAP